MSLVPEFHLRLHVCHRCPNHDGRGQCRKDGGGIVQHAERGTCPIKAFEQPTRDYLHGLIGIAKAVMPGVDRAAKETVATRRTICRGCPESTPTPIGTRSCKLCGCQLWAKTKLAGEKCPLAKW